MLNIDKINKALLDPMAKARGLRSVFGQDALFCFSWAIRFDRIMKVFDLIVSLFLGFQQVCPG